MSVLIQIDTLWTVARNRRAGDDRGIPHLARSIWPTLFSGIMPLFQIYSITDYALMQG